MSQNNQYYYLNSPQKSLDHTIMKDVTFWLFKYKAAVRVVLKKRFSENMQHIYRRIPILKCDFNKAAMQLY